MFPMTVDEVVSAFSSAKNLNAALKNFLKKEVNAGNGLARLTKDLRQVVLSGRSASLRAYIEKNFQDQENAFLAIARYAHGPFVVSTLDPIFSQYGERFNATYTQSKEGIEVTDRETFATIVQQVVADVTTALEKAGLPVSNFMKNMVIANVFEPDVLKEVSKLLR